MGGGRARPGWLVLAAALPVGLPLLGQRPALAVFIGVVAALAVPVFVVQWWGRHRLRAEHAAGKRTWTGHIPLDHAVGLWDLGVAAAFRFGGGVPVRVTPTPAGLFVAVRSYAGGRRYTPVTVQWSDIAGVRAEASGRATDWGRVALLPLTTVTVDLAPPMAGAFVMTTTDAAGLVETVTAQLG
ncbi:hypothetical protein KZZ52_47850 [Dactylosporangium sp. AC04546]|uniref:hypothetical protein n=1 Tax=Dactylosporangium sp. AC04546 TaxID=2862460 RepID=UPI001EDD6D45|nr:hypothetical protein [Dactylosporangium sp. AC04546]WVK81620.1 hypothetical protein KZZ52_47850 [Dactylosporangium sp. AC04546]